MPKSTTNRRRALSFDETKGEAAVMDVQLPEAYIDTGTMISQRAWEKLVNAEQKKAALDAFFNRMDQNFSRNWQATYELITLARDYDKYWKDQGFESFEDFWRERGRFAFDQFRKLESVYNYAKQACPKLFAVDYREAKRLVEKLATVERLSHVGGNGHANSLKSRRRKKPDPVATLLDSLEPEKQSPDWQAGFRAGRGHSTVYRFGRLKRDAPRVAARVLAGKYIKFRKNGKPYLDLAQAEKDAGLFRERSTVKKTRAVRAAQNVGRLSGMKEVREFVDKLPAAVRSKLKKALIK